MSDPLEASLRALRDRASRDPADPGETRARVLRTIAGRERSRRLALASSVALALVVTNSTTWAWFTGRLPGALDAMSQSLERATERQEESARVPAPIAAGPSASPITLGPAIERREVPTPDTTARDHLVLERQQPAGAASRGIAGSQVDAPPSPALVPGAARVAPTRDRAAQVELASGAAEPDGAAAEITPTEPEIAAIDRRDREAFGAAHALHFGGGAPGDALGAWDRYLADFPEGRFVPEASWNRAICLVRLERRAAARAALEPFARGAFGGVRQRDASRLLDALSRD
jgi:hypothetical protein